MSSEPEWPPPPEIESPEPNGLPAWYVSTSFRAGLASILLSAGGYAILWIPITAASSYRDRDAIWLVELKAAGLSWMLSIITGLIGWRSIIGLVGVALSIFLAYATLQTVLHI